MTLLRSLTIIFLSQLSSNFSTNSLFKSFWSGSWKLVLFDSMRTDEHGDIGLSLIGTETGFTSGLWSRFILIFRELLRDWLRSPTETLNQELLLFELDLLEFVFTSLNQLSNSLFYLITVIFSFLDLSKWKIKITVVSWLFITFD